MFFECSRLPQSSIGPPEVWPVQPIIPFHYPLQEHRKVESFPCPGQRQTEIISWGVVTDYCQVTMIFQSIRTIVDTFFSIKIGIHNVTGSPVRPPVWGTSIGQVCIHFFLGLCNTDRFVSPDVTQYLSIIVYIRRE